jgi:ligand-binding SRPBCC domain-containing protein
MIRIGLTTQIAAPIERCFDLARNIDLHMASTNHTGERAIAGVTTGMIGAGQVVTWEGRHFGLMFKHTSRITELKFPNHFQDAMVRGMFRSFCHDHFFESRNGGTLMEDVLVFEAPYGFVGKLIERTVLEKHLRLLLEKRNDCIKRVAESDEWKSYLGRTS